MISSAHGASTSKVEVTNIDGFGVWILVNDTEYLLPYGGYPWFHSATIDQILHVELLHGCHLHWPALDVDLSLDTLADPEAYPLVHR
jgi:hypothetical protein